MAVFFWALYIIAIASVASAFGAIFSNEWSGQQVHYDAVMAYAGISVACSALIVGAAALTWMLSEREKELNKW